MSGWHLDRLNPAQVAWVEARLREPRLVSDMSWNLIESIVLRLRTSSGDEVVVKAGDSTNHHIDREIAAHPTYTQPLTSTGHAARMLDAFPEQRVMLLDYLPGHLLEGTDAELQPDAYAQAGSLLRRLHTQTSREDDEYEERTTARALSWFDRPHRLDADAEREARRILEADSAPMVSVVPTHGDWQPRNWLIDEGTVRVIDFGRFAFRPAATDLVRLAAKQWRGRPDLEHAFLDGYGEDPRDQERWRLHELREAIGTACWAYQVGDEAFEAEGHRMLADALAAF
ncbi:aminoglycoside phosphotransferase family protein [Microbacterium murale]|uniref:tRNA A-37 threonylcarbamoyl transferase component Bud32 n=1 Tax=Microbacterium murale TaxID=1081040 RepID=A0ABU0PCY7_9MICO|nr:aminoglycoside phosphotransferase family protein [Microbacterium murale]MDQ0645196.1 tRNA A-37 threonylcarbamoyl transferase component Bud32 [Microbacterium murale]